MMILESGLLFVATLNKTEDLQIVGCIWYYNVDNIRKGLIWTGE